MVLLPKMQLIKRASEQKMERGKMEPYSEHFKVVVKF